MRPLCPLLRLPHTKKGLSSQTAEALHYIQINFIFLHRMRTLDFMHPFTVEVHHEGFLKSIKRKDHTKQDLTVENRHL